MYTKIFSSAILSLGLFGSLAAAAQEVAPSSERGQQTFTRVGCHQCHGTDGQAIFAGRAWAPETMAKFVRISHGRMPAFPEEVLSDNEIADIVAYLKTEETTRITRIKMGTIGSVDLPSTEDWYTNWLGYSVVDRGEVSEALAASWGAPGVVGRPYIVMQPESGADVFIRAVKSDGVDGYKALTTFGWNSFEIIVKDVYALDRRLKDSPFKTIGGPESLGGASTIHAMQVIGPSQEVLYLTQETEPKEGGLLPTPGSFVGRPFIMVIAGPDVNAIVDFYSSKFAVAGRGAAVGGGSAIGIISRAQGLPEDHIFPTGFAGLAEHGNYIEIDGYPDSASPRPKVDGQLPPGNAIISFSVNSLDGLDLDFITPPVRDKSLAYGGKRSATVIGPAGELIELIEDPR